MRSRNHIYHEDLFRGFKSKLRELITRKVGDPIHIISGGERTGEDLCLIKDDDVSPARVFLTEKDIQ